MTICDRNQLGLTDLMVSPICIGSWQLGGPVTFDGKPDGHPDPGKKKVLRMIAELHDLGINHIDTAANTALSADVNGELNRVFGDVRLNLSSLDRWTERRIERRLRDRQTHGCIATTLQIEGFHELPETAGGNDHVPGRHLHIVEEHVRARYAPEPEQVFLLAKGETLTVLFD